MSLPQFRFLFDAVLALAGHGAGGQLAMSGTRPFCPIGPDRPWDVLLDCCGAFTLQWIVFVYVKLFRPALLFDRD